MQKEGAFMFTRIKYTMIFLIVFTLLPVQVRAEEKVETSEENVSQVENEDLKSDEALIENETDLQEVPAENKDESDLSEEYEVFPNETTGTEFSYSVIPNPTVEIAGNKWKVIKNQKYVLSITIRNNSSSDWEEILVKGSIFNAELYTVDPKYLSFYSQDGVTVRNFSADGLSPIEIDAEAVVAQLMSGDSITLQADVVIPENMGDAAALTISSELYPGAPFGYVEYDLLLEDESNPDQKNPESESGAKTAAKTSGKASSIKTAAKTGDNSSTTVYLGVIALSSITLILSRKIKLFK